MRVYNVKKIRALNATGINNSPQITDKKILPELTFVTKKWTAYVSSFFEIVSFPISRFWCRNDEDYSKLFTEY